MDVHTVMEHMERSQVLHELAQDCPLVSVSRSRMTTSSQEILTKIWLHASRCFANRVALPVALPPPPPLSLSL